MCHPSKDSPFTIAVIVADEEQEDLSSSSSFSESFCLAELLQSKSIDVSQVSFVTDNARLPSESLLESISSCTTTSSTSSQRQLQNEEAAAEEAPHQDENPKGENARRRRSRKSVVGKPKNCKPRHPCHPQGVVSTKTAPFYLPNIPFGSIMLDGSSSSSSSSSSSTDDSDLDVDGVMEILDESLDILEDTTRLFPTISSCR